MRSEWITKRPVIAMANPLPFPGSIRNRGEKIDVIASKMLDEVKILVDGGVDGILLQNFNDGPNRQDASRESCSYMTRVASDIRREYPDLVIGILMCWDGPGSIIVAEASGADFIRVEHVYCGAEMTAAGIIQGQCVETLKMRKALCSNMPIYADVYEPHSLPIIKEPMESALYETVKGGLADGLFLCGHSAEESKEYARIAKSMFPEVPCICGGGSNKDNVGTLREVFDGVCVGAWIKDGSLNNPVNPEKLRLYMDEVRRRRGE